MSSVFGAASATGPQPKQRAAIKSASNTHLVFITFMRLLSIMLVNLRLGCFAACLHEIKVTSQMRLRHVRRIQSAEAALVPRRRWLPLCASPRDFVSFDQQVKL